jgi:hypothetical protein
MPSKLASPISPGLGPSAPDARVLIAGLRARQTEIIGEVVDDSLERMAELRETREEERAERERLEDRLRAIARRERADAEASVRAADDRRAEARARAARGDDAARLEENRAASDAAQGRLDARRARADLIA